MNKYEFTFLLNDETELKELKKTLQSLSGNILKEQPWGERILAYPINKQTKANFYTWFIEIEKKNLKEFEKKLNYNEKLIRTMILTSEE